MEEKKKLIWLSILQGWTMLWVVIGHSPLSTLTSASLFDVHCHRLALSMQQIAYSFHMPLFIMISGYLFYHTRIRQKYRFIDMLTDKLKRLGIPYLLFITLAYLIKSFFTEGMKRQVDISAISFINGFLYPFDGALQEMWFVASILWYFSGLNIYRIILKRRIVIWLVLCGALLCFFIPVNCITGFLSVNRAVHFFVFFLVGILIASQNMEKKISSKYLLTINTLAFVLSFLIHNELLAALSGCLLFWGLSIHVAATHRLLFSSFRDDTYQIFLMGIFIQIAIKMVYVRLSFPDTYCLFYLCCVLSGIYVPVLIAKSAKRRNSTLLKYSLGL